MIKELIKLANHLDSKGFVKEADYLDGVIKESSENESILDAETYFNAKELLKKYENILYQQKRELQKLSNKYEGEYRIAIEYGDDGSISFNMGMPLDEDKKEEFIKEMTAHNFKYIPEEYGDNFFTFYAK